MSDDPLRDILDVNRLIHEPARLLIVSLLYGAASADFLFLLRESGLTKGNLSSHLSKLEDAGYVLIDKTFEGKTPRTTCRLTDEGRAAFVAYRTRLQRAIEATPSRTAKDVK